MLQAFAVYSVLILGTFSWAGYEGYSVSSMFADSKHLGPGTPHTHTYYSGYGGGHYHK